MKNTNKGVGFANDETFGFFRYPYVQANDETFGFFRYPRGEADQCTASSSRTISGGSPSLIDTISNRTLPCQLVEKM